MSEFDPFLPEPSSSNESSVPTACVQLASPPLGIGHLLLWMTCSAVLLTANSIINDVIEKKWAFVVEQQRFFEGARSILAGPAVAALLIWAARKRRGLKFPVQPGEWLLVLYGFATLLFLLGSAVWSSGIFPMELGSRIFVLPIGIVTVCYLLVALLPPMPKWWRVTFFLLTGAWGYEFARHLNYAIYSWMYSPFFESLSHLEPILYVVPLLSLLVCLLIDRSKRIRRGWLHWIGVAICVANLILEVAQMVYYWIVLT